MASKLPNYVRVHRTKAGFSSRELATLLGWSGADQVSRLEKFRRRPNLKTLIACEVILGVPAPELFAGFYDAARAIGRFRAKKLLEKIVVEPPGLLRELRIKSLEKIINPPNNVNHDKQSK